MQPPVEPVLVVHGGAGNIPDELVADYEAGVRAALDAGWAVLERGGSAVDAVESAVASMEDCGIFDAGRGSVLNQDGRVQLDAMIMDGASLAAGGIGAAEMVRNPIRVARAVMGRTPQVYFGGHGADRFAMEHGFEPIDNAQLVSPRERRRFEEARRLAADGQDPMASERSVTDIRGVGQLRLHADEVFKCVLDRQVMPFEQQPASKGRRFRPRWLGTGTL